MARASCESQRQLVFKRLKENSIGFPGGSSQWFIALLPGRVCRGGTAAIWGEKKDMLRGKGFYRAQHRTGKRPSVSGHRLAAVIFFDRKHYTTPLKVLFLSNSILLNGLRGARTISSDLQAMLLQLK